MGGKAGGAALSPLSALSGASNDRTPGNRMGSAGNRFNSAYKTFENLTLSYDDLVAMGRLKPGEDYFGLKGGESRLGRLVVADGLDQAHLLRPHRDGLQAHALGVVMYQLLSGRLPFQASSNFGSSFECFEGLFVCSN